jgi:cell division protease FtsH
MIMMTLTDRIAHYLLRRLERKALNETYRRAEAAGLLTHEFLVDEDENSGLAWRRPSSLPLKLSGDAEEDRASIERHLGRRVPGETNPLSGDFDLDAEDDLNPSGRGFYGKPKGKGASFSPRFGTSAKDQKNTTGSPSADETGQSVTAVELSKNDSDAGEGEGEGEVTSGGGEVLPVSQASSIETGEKLGIDRASLLRLIRALRPKPAVADAAVALLLARAVGSSVPDLETLVEILRRPNPSIVVRAGVGEFEEQFGKLLENGLIMPFAVNMSDAFGDRALGGRYRDNVLEPHRLLTISGKSARTRSAGSIRKALVRTALYCETPLLVADEIISSALPPRLLAGADLVLQTDGVDREMLAELMHVCLGIAPKTSLAAMDAVGFRPCNLGIDDLALALKKGRTPEKMIAVLADLMNATEAESAEDNGDNGNPVSGRGGRDSRSSSRQSRTSASFEITQPAEPTATIDQTAITNDAAADSGQGRSGAFEKDRLLLVETLAGYGEARAWALDLKDDLELWRAGKLAWSDMSSKMLLSGPPGTGKTTFARALCNSLQVPMLATSLSTMLEPGYLGDVLKSMSAAFEIAREHAPSILFLDELDNIGRRVTGGKDSDYWNSLINRMLELLDGAGRTEGVIVVAATNHPERIDPALLRSGRLETRIEIQPPDVTALAGILEHHLGNDLPRILATKPKKSIVAANNEKTPGKADISTSRTSVQKRKPAEPVKRRGARL